MRTFERLAENVRVDEDFLMRARVQSFGLARLWPALENLSGRKPRGLGGVYGERALSIGLVTAAATFLVRLKTAVRTFCPLACLRSELVRCQFAPLTLFAGSLRTSDFGRCRRNNRIALGGMDGQSVMRPVSLVERGIEEPGRA